MEDPTSGVVCTDPSEPMFPAQEIHCSKCITGLEAHKTGKIHYGTHCCFLRPHIITLPIVTSLPGSHVPAVPWEPTVAVPTAPGSRPFSSRTPGKGLRELPAGSLNIPRRLCRSRGVQVGARGCCGAIPAQGDAQDPALVPPLPQAQGMCQSCAQCLSSLSLGKINAALVVCIY